MLLGKNWGYSMADDFDPDKFLKEDTKGSTFDPDAFLEESELAEPIDRTVNTEDQSTAGEAYTSGVFDDLSIGYMDELKGALEAGGQAVGIKGLGKEFGKQELQKPIGFDLEELLKVYREGRDVERQRQQELETQHPAAYKAGELTGMLGPIALTGGTAAMKGLLGTGAKILTKKGAKEGLKETGKQQFKKLAKSGATVGGAATLGETETELLEDPIQAAKETATGAAIGAGVGLAMPAAVKTSAKALKTIGKGIKEGSKRITSIMAGLEKGDLEEVIKRADDIKDAVDYPEIQETIIDKTRQTLNNMQELAEVGSKVLPDKKNVPKDLVKSAIQKRIQNIRNTADDPAVAELKKIIGYIDDQEKFGGELISLRDMQKIVQDTGKRAYKGVASDAPGTVRTQLRETYNDLSTILKEAAPKKYSKISEELQKRYNLLDKLEKELGIKVNYDEVINKSEDKLISKLQQVGKLDATGRRRQDIEKLLGELEELQGKKIDELSLADKLKARRLQGILNKEGDHYSYGPRAIVGAVLGNIVPGIGNVVGTTAGVMSRPVTRALLKKSGRLNKLKLSERAAKTVDAATKSGAPLGLAKGLQTGVDVAIDQNRVESKLEDPQYIEGLISELEKSQIPGNEVFASQLEKYREADNSQQKTQIQYGLSQQPAFRELIKQYEEVKKK